MKILIILSGGYHPISPHHVYLWNKLNNEFPSADIFLAASNNTKTRPFPFICKQFLASQAGIPSNHFIQVSQPYKPIEITSCYDPAKTILIMPLSSKDSNRFIMNSSSYFQPFSQIDDCTAMNNHGYIMNIPSIKYHLNGSIISSASQIRDMYHTSKNKSEFLKMLYPHCTDLYKIKQIFDAVLGNA
jgi:hypothetical protein